MTDLVAAPVIDEFSGAPTDDTSQSPDSLQVVQGSSVLLRWKLSQAPDGAELTDSSSGETKLFPAAIASVEVTPGSELQSYVLVALSGSSRSAPQSVLVCTHEPDEVVSGHAIVQAPGFYNDWEMMHGPVPASPLLTRPLVMITGLTMHASSYDPMAKAFARIAANGLVHVYECATNTFHSGSLTGPLSSQLHDQRLFQVEYINVGGAPSDKAPQLARAFQDIAEQTGADTFDVVCHSAGCTDFRLYLNTRPADAAAISIGQVSFIGPASHGTEMGNFGKTFGGIAGLQKAGGELAVGSALIASLNDSWPAQRAEMASCQIIGITGAPTMGPNGISDGDGFMPISECAMPEATLVALRGLDPTAIAHLEEVGYSGVIGAVQLPLSAGVAAIAG